MNFFVLLFMILINCGVAMADCPPATVQATESGDGYQLTIGGKTLWVPKVSGGNRHSELTADCVASGDWVVTPYTPAADYLKAQVGQEASARIDALADQATINRYNGRATELVLTRLQNGAWTSEETAEAADIQNFFAWTKSVRSNETAVKACIDGLTDSERRTFDPASPEAACPGLAWPATP